MSIYTFKLGIRDELKKYEYNGQMLDLKTISELKGVKYNTLWQRINKYGYTFEKALL